MAAYRYFLFCHLLVITDSNYSNICAMLKQKCNLCLSYLPLLTKGVVDDLKQSKVAGCYTVHL